jgi:hypothetical protein
MRTWRAPSSQASSAFATLIVMGVPHETPWMSNASDPATRSPRSCWTFGAALHTG